MRHCHTNTYLLRVAGIFPILLQQVVAPRSENDLVVHVRYVHHEQAVIAKVVLQHAAHDVERHVVSRMAHVRGVVDGRPARVPRDGFAASTGCWDERHLVGNVTAERRQAGAGIGDRGACAMGSERQNHWAGVVALRRAGERRLDAPFRRPDCCTAAVRAVRLGTAGTTRAGGRQPSTSTRGSAASVQGQRRRGRAARIVLGAGASCSHVAFWLVASGFVVGRKSG